MSEQETYRYKIILVGNAGVGKTSLVNRFTTNKFSNDYRKTMGVNFTIKKVYFVNETIRIILQIWDIAGDFRFQQVWADYFSGADGVMIVFDVADKNSFLDEGGSFEIDNWVKRVEKVCKRLLPSIVLGNKADLQEEREVSKEEVEACLITSNYPYLETSAKSGANVDKAFRLIAKKLVKDTQGIDIDKLEKRVVEGEPDMKYIKSLYLEN